MTAKQEPSEPNFAPLPNAPNILLDAFKALVTFATSLLVLAAGFAQQLTAGPWPGMARMFLIPGIAFASGCVASSLYGSFCIYGMAWKGYDERSKRDGETADKCALYAFMCACLCVADIGAFSAVRSLSGLLSEKQAYKIATHQLKGMNLGSHWQLVGFEKNGDVFKFQIQRSEDHVRYTVGVSSNTGEIVNCQPD